MTDRLTNTSGGRIGYWTADLSDNEQSAVVVLRVLPADGFFLKAAPEDDDVQIMARRTSSGDPFVDIAATPIDLSALTPETPTQYDFKAVAASNLTDVRRVPFFIGVTNQSAASWDL